MQKDNRQLGSVIISVTLRPKIRDPSITTLHTVLTPHSSVKAVEQSYDDRGRLSQFDISG